MLFKKIGSLLFFIFAVLSASTQTYYFDNYSVKEGLSQSTIFAVIQDTSGYVWLGTQSGVSRFDGNNFKNYTVNDGLAGNSVRTITQDKKGNIWFGHTGGGISYYNGGSFQEIHLDTFEVNSDITSIVQDYKGRIWIGSVSSGVIRIDNPEEPIEKFKYKSYKGNEGLSDRVFYVYMGTDSTLYFIIDANVKTYNFELDEFEILDLENRPLYFQNTCIYQDSKRNIWIGTYNGGLYKYDASSGKTRVFDTRDGLGHNWVSSVEEDASGDIWAGTWGGGITRIRGEVLKNFNTTNGLHHDKIFSISKDREGNLLIGTFESGLDIYKGEEFISYSSTDGLPDNQVWSIAEDQSGSIWLGTNKGIAILDQSKPAQEQFTYINQEKDFLSHDNIRHLKADRYGNIWVGTWGGGVMRFNFTISRNREYVSAINSRLPTGAFVTALEVDGYGNVWVGSTDGLFKYNPKVQSVIYYSQLDGLSGNDISCLYVDEDGVIWVGSRGKGLNKIIGKEVVKLDVGGDITINTMTKDKKGQLWLGTDGQGLLVCDPGGNIILQFTTQDGLLADLITMLQVDEKGNIWMGTNNGLNKFNVEEEKIYAYTEKNGFVGIEAKNGSSYQDSKGNLWFGTVKGVMKYNPQYAKDEHFESLTHITDMKVNLNDVEMVDGMEFDYTQRSFYFNYNSIYLTNPKSIRYLYMLEGLDDQWSFPTKVNFANYPALPPGEYTFKVKAVNSAGIWNKEPITFTFKINPPFWQTWWFYLIVVVLLALGIFYFIKWREQNLRREKKILEDKVAERTAEVVEMNLELASKNKDITDSIRYAKRIQNAILPPDEMISKALSDAFIFFKPKDIVSGDFYWVATKEDKVFFAAVDCTGHGVPGAFMSIIGHNSLDKIISETDIIKPSEILDELNRNVTETLRQKDEESAVKDGMDISLVCLDRKKMSMEYAAAHNSLYIVRKDELIETKADKFAIGSFVRQERNKFTNHQIKLEKGDVIYVFSDGFADQFGGKDGKKFKYRPFKEMLLGINKLPMNKQKDHVEKVFLDWMGDEHEQIDDVIIIGVKV